MTVDAPLLAFNAGEISRFGLARVDLAKLRIACEQQLNFLPSVLGYAMLRPGTQYLEGVPDNIQSRFAEFYTSETERVLLCMQAGKLFFLVDGAWIGRASVSATITNGDFPTDLTGWTDSDDAGASSFWSSGLAMMFRGTGSNYAWRDQQVTVTETGTEHALRIVVIGESVILKVGAAAAGNVDYVNTELRTGTHSIAFIPSGNFWIRIGSNKKYVSGISHIAIETAGIMHLPLPYSSYSQLSTLGYDQSLDVIFMSGGGKGPLRIERHASNSRSWSVSNYRPIDGPFRLPNLTGVRIAPSATTGSITLTASARLFAAAHYGALWKLTHPGQTATGTLGALNNDSGNIRVSGLAAHGGNASQRTFTIVIDGTFVGTISLERSLAEPGSWNAVTTYTAPTTATYDDALDNQIIYYRLRMSAYTSGSADVTLTYLASSQTGIARVGVAAADGLTIQAEVLQEFGAATATADWSEGEWSDYRGWPGAVAIHDGRLCWFAGISAQCSVSDAYDSFDDTIEGDSGPINRVIATGGNDSVRWALSMSRLLAATLTQEVSIRSSTLDGPLTPTEFGARVCSTRGAARIRPVKVGSVGIFVGRDTRRVFELAHDFNTQDYRSKELTRLKQEMCAAGVVDVAVQTQPDTRVWFVLADGRCAVLTYEQDDDVVSWISVDTDGSFEAVAVLPGGAEDDVYFSVRRTINGSTKRYIERLGQRSYARGGTFNRTVDSFLVYSGASTNSISAPHLAAKQVAVWAGGLPYPSLVTLDGSGNGTLTASVPTYVVGLAYSGRIKTSKLAYAAEHGTALTAKKRVSRVGLVMADTTWEGVKIGRDFTNQTGLPATYRGRALTTGEMLAAYDAMVPYNGGWDEDSRVCIQVTSPHCCTLMGLALHMETNEPVEHAKPVAVEEAGA